METKSKCEGVKVSPDFLRAIGLDPDNMPTVLEALEAQKDVDILAHQGINLFLSKSVRCVMNGVKRRHGKELLEISAFNYGYILGKRAERARRKMRE